MRSAGKVVNFSNKGSIILRADKPPRIGDIVIDRRSNPVGKVIRITGPVSSPYVILGPMVRDARLLQTLLGREVYISDKEPKRPYSKRPQNRPHARRPDDGRRHQGQRPQKQGGRGGPSDGEGKKYHKRR